MINLILLGGIFLLFYIVESALPQIRGEGFKKNHDLSNLGLGVINFLLSRYFALIITFTLVKTLQNRGIGILNYFQFQGKYPLILGIVMLDCINYWWHRLLHRVPLFMRFHTVHHTDTLLDVSSALRFHFVEVLAGHLFRVPFILILGLPLESLIFYDIIFNINVYFHNSNIRINRTLDIALSKVIVTPYIHRIHHSTKWKEANSNFSSFLLLWDRLFTTYTPQGEISTPKYGIPGYTDDRYQNFSYMVRQPFIK